MRGLSVVVNLMAGNCWLCMQRRSLYKACEDIWKSEAAEDVWRCECTVVNLSLLRYRCQNVSYPNQAYMCTACSYPSFVSF